MNQVRWKIVNELDSNVTFSYITKKRRIELGLEKSHKEDAFVIAEGLEILGYDEGDICIVLDECAEGIVQCLRQGEPDKETRLEWLETLLDAVIAEGYKALHEVMDKGLSKMKHSR